MSESEAWSIFICMNTIYIYHALKKENLRTKSIFYIISSLPGKLLLIYNLSMQRLFGPTGRSVSLPCNQHINSLPKQILFFFFLIYVGCPGQLTRTTTIPHGPLDILQAQEQVRHRGGDRRAHRGSNPGRGRNKSHCWPQQLDPQVRLSKFLMMLIIHSISMFMNQDTC